MSDAHAQAAALLHRLSPRAAAEAILGLEPWRESAQLCGDRQVVRDLDAVIAVLRLVAQRAVEVRAEGAAIVVSLPKRPR